MIEVGDLVRHNTNIMFKFTALLVTAIDGNNITCRYTGLIGVLGVRVFHRNELTLYKKAVK